MKGLILALAMVGASSAFGYATTDNNAYYTITSTEVHEIAQVADTVPPQIGDCSKKPADFSGDLSDIVNVGKVVWDIIQAGKPVLDVKTDVGSALPQGRSCWSELQGWHVPQTKRYSVVSKNGFGMEVVRLSYRVMWMSGGNVNGVGKYIAYATVFPEDINVMWGFKLNANVSIPVVGNVGSKDAPVAGMQMQIRYQIESPIQTVNQGQAYFVDGNGTLTSLQQ